MTQTAIRHPKHGKAHRIGIWTGAIDRPEDHPLATGCGHSTRGYELVPLAQTALEDRCKVCWGTPAPPARRRSS